MSNARNKKGRRRGPRPAARNVVWVEELPPPAARGRKPGSKTKRKGNLYDPFFKAMRSTPGRWMVFGEYGTAQSAAMTGSHLRKGKYAGCEEGEFEAAARTVDGKHMVYARYAPSMAVDDPQGAVHDAPSLSATPALPSRIDWSARPESVTVGDLPGSNPPVQGPGGWADMAPSTPPGLIG